MPPSPSLPRPGSLVYPHLPAVTGASSSSRSSNSSGDDDDDDGRPPTPPATVVGDLLFLERIGKEWMAAVYFKLGEPSYLPAKQLMSNNYQVEKDAADNNQTWLLTSRRKQDPSATTATLASLTPGTIPPEYPPGTVIGKKFPNPATGRMKLYRGEILWWEIRSSEGGSSLDVALVYYEDRDHEHMDVGEVAKYMLPPADVSKNENNKNKNSSKRKRSSAPTSSTEKAAAVSSTTTSSAESTRHEVDSRRPRRSKKKVNYCEDNDGSMDDEDESPTNSSNEAVRRSSRRPKRTATPRRQPNKSKAAANLSDSEASISAVEHDDDDDLSSIVEALDEDDDYDEDNEDKKRRARPTTSNKNKKHHPRKKPPRVARPWPSRFDLSLLRPTPGCPWTKFNKKLTISIPLVRKGPMVLL